MMMALLCLLGGMTGVSLPGEKRPTEGTAHNRATERPALALRGKALPAHPPGRAGESKTFGEIPPDLLDCHDGVPLIRPVEKPADPHSLAGATLLYPKLAIKPARNARRLLRLRSVGQPAVRQREGGRAVCPLLEWRQDPRGAAFMYGRSLTDKRKEIQ
jgi:hypothetical protein